METTISIMTIIAISSFAAGWFIKQQNIINDMRAVLKDMKSTAENQKQHLQNAEQHLEDSNIVIDMAKETETIRTEILRIKDYKKQVRSMADEIDKEYLEKLRIIEEGKKHESESQQRLEKLKSKSSALKQ